MENEAPILASFINVIRWITRIFSALAILFTLMMELGELLANESNDGSGVQTTMIFAGVMMLGGLLVAWKWEVWGGLISLAGFFQVAFINPRVWQLPMMYILFLTPALLFLICGLVKRFFLVRKSEV